MIDHTATREVEARVFGDTTLGRALENEGWIPPDSNLLPVCGAKVKHLFLEPQVCLLRRGHDGDHASGNRFGITCTWNDSVAYGDY